MPWSSPTGWNTAAWSRAAIVGGGGGTTLNPADKSANITLSGGNLIATANTTGFSGVRATSSTSTGKRYFEVTITNEVVTNGGVMVGIETAGASLLHFVGWDSGGYSYSSEGGIYFNSTNPGLPASYTTGAVCAVAVDFDAHLLWFRCTTAYSNAWFGPAGLSGADPLAGTNGFDISVMNAGPYFPAISVATSGDIMTANFGGSAYVTAAPSGYGNF